MKTPQEIQTEARQLATLGRQRMAELTAGSGESRVLARFVGAELRPGDSADSARALSAAPSTRERIVDAVVLRNELVYRLTESEPRTRATDGFDGADTVPVVVATGSAFDVVRAGYARAEGERLADELAAYADREGDRADATDEAVDDVEGILETEQLPYADRMRTRAEIAGFLSGQVHVNDLISHTVERHLAREFRREVITARHELRLTIDEP